MKPEYTLHKLSEGFVLYKEEIIPYNPNGGTKGSFICVYELKYNDDTKWVSNVGSCQGCRKLLASSFDILRFPNLPKIDFSPLSEEEQKEIKHFDKLKLIKQFSQEGSWQCPISYEIGFNKAQELLSDRMFTLEDITKTFEAGYQCRNSNGYKTNGTYQEDYNNHIQSLTQSKSWKIEGQWENDKFKINKIL
jgi:hypothetical protein